jgi:hypothetical protein
MVFPDNDDGILNEFLKSLLKKKPYERVCNLSILKDSTFLADFSFVSLFNFRMIYWNLN